VEVFDKSVCKLFSKDCIIDVGEEESSYVDCCSDDDLIISIDEKCNPFNGKNVDAYSFHDTCLLYNELSHKTIVSGLSKVSFGGGKDDVTILRPHCLLTL